MISLTTDDRFVPIHIGGTRKRGRRGDNGGTMDGETGDDGETGTTGDAKGGGGTTGGWGDGGVLIHFLLKTLHSFHCADAIWMFFAMSITVTSI